MQGVNKPCFSRGFEVFYLPFFGSYFVLKRILEIQMKTFFGGVHPKEYKELTEDLLIEDLPVSDIYYLALAQHFGKPATPCVKPGDSVSEGDLIAEAAGFISAPIHSPVTGKVKKIGVHPYVLGQAQDTIIIERDKDAAPKRWERNMKTIDQVTKEDFIASIRDNGVVGLGGAGFPTCVKFMLNDTQRLDTIVVNACECEPYVTVDFRAMVEQTDMFVDGLVLMQKTLGVSSIIVGVEDNKPEAIRLLKGKVTSLPGIEIQPVKTKYPQGGEKMLIKALLNKEVPRGGLPIDIGIVVVNVNTVIAMMQAVFYDKPILDKLVTVSGYGVRIPKNVRVRVGVLFSEVIDFCGGLKQDAQRLIVGGPMMGFAQPSDQASVLKTTTGLLALTEKELVDVPIQACVRCANCVRQCPMGLVPCDIAKYVRYDRLDLAVETGLSDCIECGCCVYGCPSNRPLVQMIKIGKLKQRERQQAKGA